MPTPRIALTHEPEFHAFDYEQCPIGREEGIYKFDHVPHQDGHWHRLNSATTAVYRYLDDYFQFVGLSDDDAPLEGVLALLEQAGPLRTDDELEILVRSAEDGFEMTSHWIFLGEGAAFNEFTPLAWNNAYGRLRQLEDGA